jgi:hypothetical protein
MSVLTVEQESWVATTLAQKVEDYKVKHAGQSPGGKWVSEQKQALELMLLPLSEIIVRMLKIGHPDNIHNRETQRSEFTVLAHELDRREQTYLTKPSA